jgi:integrase
VPNTLADDQYLIKKSRTWFVAVEVPPSLRAVMGKRRLTRTLGTDDLRAARVKKHPVVGELKGLIARARQREEQRAKSEKDAVVVEGLQWRGEQDPLILDDIATEIERKSGAHAAQTFHAVATGTATPLEAHIESWLGAATYAQRTKSDYRSALGRLARFLQRDDVLGSATIEGVTSKVVGRFINEGLLRAAVHRVTAKRIVLACRVYWGWLGESGYLGDDWRNPWQGRKITVDSVRSGEDEERPFTEVEVASLLLQPCKKNRQGYRLREDDKDVMMIAALSGLRQEEIFQLRVKDAINGYLDVTGNQRKVKARASIRKVPVHSALAGTVARLTKGRDPEAFLIEDADATGWDGARGMAFSKRFATYRRRQGVDDMRGQGGNRRRSRVNFHSFRRWFSTKCEQAGVPEALAARVLGHKISSMSYGVYSGGASLEQLRGVVEAVRLPDASSYLLPIPAA